MIVYAAIGAVGLLLLVVMLLVGELGDHDLHVGEMDADGGGPSVFSTRVIAAFLTAFGAGGVLARYFGWTHPQSVAAGAGCGLVIGGLVYALARFLYSQQSTSHTRMADLVGKLGEVSVAIPAGGLGQITLVHAGERSTHIARAADGAAVPLGAEVRISALRGDSVIVTRGEAPAAGGVS
jgi:membrane protein implicated in regulation of membrane protease activity